MKTIGIIGGMSAESTAVYYQLINRETNRRLGLNHSAEILLYSIDFERIVRLQKAGGWTEAAGILAQAALKLQNAGSEAVVLATNTMHKVADAIEAVLDVPFIHLIDVTAAALKRQGVQKAALLGTRFTMNDGFYAARMAQSGIETLVPDEAAQQEIHRIIFEELCLGIIREEARGFYRRQIDGLKQAGAEAVILGCTEIGLLITQADSALPVFDSTGLHVQAAVDFALS